MIDDFIGTVFGDEGQILVTDRTDVVVSSHRQYIVICSKCSTDKEIFPDKLLVSKYSLIRGSYPCGCSKSPKWDKRQTEIRVSRKLAEKNMKFLSWAEPYKGAATKMVVLCKTCMCVTLSLLPYSVLSLGNSCDSCRVIQTGRRNRTSKEVVLSKLPSGVFPDGFHITLMDGVAASSAVYYFCPKCDSDKYSSAGISSGIFITSSESLLGGHLPCRCQVGYIFPERLQKYRLEQIGYNQHGSKFIDFVTQYKGLSTLSKIICQKHGEYTSTVEKFLVGNACPSCPSTHVRRSKAAYLYVLRVKTQGGGFIGYGISFRPSKRLGTHLLNFKKHGMELSSMTIYESDGESIFTAEQIMKKFLPVNQQNIVGFVQESTYETLEEYANTLAGCYADIKTIVKGDEVKEWMKKERQKLKLAS